MSGSPGLVPSFWKVLAGVYKMGDPSVLIDELRKGRSGAMEFDYPPPLPIDYADMGWGFDGSKDVDPWSVSCLIWLTDIRLCVKITWTCPPLGHLHVVPKRITDWHSHITKHSIYSRLY